MDFRQIDKQIYDEGGNFRGNATQIDNENNGFIDSLSVSFDTDGDGAIDYSGLDQYLDTDGNGVTDIIVTTKDTNLDGSIDEVLISRDADEDGNWDREEYVPQQEEPETYEAEQTSDYTQEETTQANGEYTELGSKEIDFNNDGVKDTVTFYGKDENGDGVYESQVGIVDLSSDGSNDIVEIADLDENGEAISSHQTVMVDENADGVTDYIEENIFDGEGNLISTYQTHTNDTDGDGVIDTIVISKDENGDGTFDGYEQTNYNTGEVTFYDANADRITPYSGEVDGYYNPYETSSEDIIGNPSAAIDGYHTQETDSSCAVVSQEFVIEQLLGIEVSEAELRELADSEDWWSADIGTYFSDMGKLMDSYGLKTESTYGNDLSDIEDALEAGGGVIVAIDSGEIWNSELDYGPGDYGSDHAVQVIGIDKSDPENPVVILNDPGIGNGAGIEIPYDVFMDAWQDSDCFMVEAYA